MTSPRLDGPAHGEWHVRQYTGLYRLLHFAPSTTQARVLFGRYRRLRPDVNEHVIVLPNQRAFFVCATDGRVGVRPVIDGKVM